MITGVAPDFIPSTAIRVLLTLLVTLVAGGSGSLEASWFTAGQPLGLSGGHLRAGVDASYPPLAMVYQDGTLAGLEVELAREVASRLLVQLELRNTDVGGGLDALPAGEFDLLIAGLNRTRDLEDRVAFSEPYFEDGPRFVSAGSVPSVDTVSGQVAVELGSYADEVLRGRSSRFPHLEVIRFTDQESVIEALKSGAAAVAALDSTTALQAAAVNQELSLSAEPLESRPLVIALRRQNRGLVLATNRVLRDMHSDGTLQGLSNRWMSGSRSVETR